jgi:hypothetical protein
LKYTVLLYGDEIKIVYDDEPRPFLQGHRYWFCTDEVIVYLQNKYSNEVLTKAIAISLVNEMLENRKLIERKNKLDKTDTIKKAESYA